MHENRKNEFDIIGEAYTKWRASSGNCDLVVQTAKKVSKEGIEKMKKQIQEERETIKKYQIELDRKREDVQKKEADMLLKETFLWAVLHISELQE